MRTLLRNIHSCGGLCKARISLFSAFSAATGFLMASSGADRGLIALTAGVFLLSCGSCALNQYQERETDALMPRTMNRPLPSGRIAPRLALLSSFFLICSGFTVLAAVRSSLVPALGLFAVIWYNGVYTPLKKRTAFALIPGALVGMVPPAMGWVAGGGSVTDPGLPFLCFFFFMWQVPHFWLLVLNYGREYEEAGLPSLTAVFTRVQLLRLISHWIFGAAMSCLLISLNGLVRAGTTRFLLFGLSLWLVGNGIGILRSHGSEFIHPYAFRRVNLYMFLAMVLLSVDRLFV